MVVYIEENGKVTIVMVMVTAYMLTGQFTKVHGKMMYIMERVH